MSRGKRKIQFRVWFAEYGEAQAHGTEFLTVESFGLHEGISRGFDISLVCRSTAHDIALDSLVGRGVVFASYADDTAQAPWHLWSGVCTEVRQESMHAGEGENTGSRYVLTVVDALQRLKLRKNNRVFQHASIPEIVARILREWGIEFDARLVQDAEGDARKTYPKFEYRVQYNESDYDFVKRMLEEAGISYYYKHRNDVLRQEDVEGSLGLLLSTLVLDDRPQVSPGQGEKDGRFAARDKNQFDPEQAIRYMGQRDDVAKFVTADKKPWVINLGFSRTLHPGRVAVRDFDFRRNLDDQLYYTAAASTQDDTAANELPFEQYHYLAGNSIVDTDQGYGANIHYGQDLANRELQAQRQYRRMIEFTTNIGSIGPGSLLSLRELKELGQVVEALRPEFQGKRPLLVIETGQSGSVETGLAPVFCRAVFADEQYRPPCETPKPRIVGLQSAIVVGPPGEEIYCDELGRVRVQFHWDRDHTYGDALTLEKELGTPEERLLEKMSSCWVRVGQAWAGANYGMFATPRIGHEVLVQFLEGDPDNPVIVGSVHNARSMPLRAPDRAPLGSSEARPVPLGTVTGFRTDSTKRASDQGDNGYNELLFGDEAGREFISIQAQRDFQKIVRNDESIDIGDSRETRVGKVEHIDVGEEYAVRVGADNGLRIHKGHVIELTVGASSIVMSEAGIFFNTKGEVHIHAGKDLHLSAMGTINADGKNIALNDPGSHAPAPGTCHVGAVAPPDRGLDNPDSRFAPIGGGFVPPPPGAFGFADVEVPGHPAPEVPLPEIAAAPRAQAADAPAPKGAPASAAPQASAPPGATPEGHVAAAPAASAPPSPAAAPPAPNFMQAAALSVGTAAAAAAVQGQSAQGAAVGAVAGLVPGNIPTGAIGALASGNVGAAKAAVVTSAASKIPIPGVGDAAAALAQGASPEAAIQDAAKNLAQGAVKDKVASLLPKIG